MKNHHVDPCSEYGIHERITLVPSSTRERERERSNFFWKSVKRQSWYFRLVTEHDTLYWTFWKYSTKLTAQEQKPFCHLCKHLISGCSGSQNKCNVQQETLSICWRASQNKLLHICPLRQSYVIPSLRKCLYVAAEAQRTIAERRILPWELLKKVTRILARTEGALNFHWLKAGVNNI